MKLDLTLIYLSITHGLKWQNVILPGIVLQHNTDTSLPQCNSGSEVSLVQ